MITLNNGSTVSGMVTNDTEIECESSSMSHDDAVETMAAVTTAAVTTPARGGGDDNGQGDDQNENENNQAARWRT